MFKHRAPTSSSPFSPRRPPWYYKKYIIIGCWRSGGATVHINKNEWFVSSPVVWTYTTDSKYSYLVKVLDVLLVQVHVRRLWNVRISCKGTKDPLHICLLFHLWYVLMFVKAQRENPRIKLYFGEWTYCCVRPTECVSFYIQHEKIVSVT